MVVISHGSVNRIHNSWYQYIDVIWRHWCFESPTTRLFVQKHARANNEENIKTPYFWPFVSMKPATVGFLSQRAHIAESVSKSWRHRVVNHIGVYSSSVLLQVPCWSVNGPIWRQASFSHHSGQLIGTICRPRRNEKIISGKSWPASDSPYKYFLIRTRPAKITWQHSPQKGSVMRKRFHDLIMFAKEQEFISI